MVFRFYSNTISQASRAIAGWIFLVGMFLIGFGLMIYLMPEFFAALAAIILCTIGIGCTITAAKIFWSSRGRGDSGSSQGYRENVHIRIEEHHDQ